MKNDASSDRLISIVIVNYNYGRFLRDGIQSALDQTYRLVEVVVVDDASTDDSAEIIRSFGDRIVRVLKPTNAGQAAAFNSGYAASTGAIVMALDSDDYLFPDAAMRVASLYAPGVALIQSRLAVVDQSGQTVGLYPPKEIPLDTGNVAPLLLQEGRYNTTVTSGLAFDRHVLEIVMPVPADDFARAVDGYLVTVAPLFGTVAANDVPIGAYRRHGENHSQFADKLAERARWRIDHDMHRYGVLRRFAAKLGLKVEADVGFNDPMHLEERIASLAWDPANHPFPADSRRALARHGVRAVGHARLSATRRRILQLWYVGCGVLPGFIARPLISWKLADNSRPEWVRRLARSARVFAN